MRHFGLGFSFAMTAISMRVLADAVIRYERLGFDERLKLADEVHDRQPNLFFSVLALKLYDATMVQIEFVLDLLFVYYTAMQISGHTWPLITEDEQERCLKRVTGRVRFIEGLSDKLQTQAITDAVSDHPEKLLLAYLYGKFKEHGYSGIDTEAQKMMMLAALNMVECIAEAAPRSAKRRG